MIHEGWAIVCIVGVWGWILSGTGFILKVFPRRDKFQHRPAAIWGGSFILFYVLWVVGMINT
jgi:hypothetical protein